MKIFSKLFIALSTLVLTACSSDTNISDSPSADLVFHHGKIYTVDEQQPWAEAVAVSNGEIVFVGSNEAVKKWVGENTKQQDLQGKMLLPGFIDSHAHPVMGGAYVRSLSLDSFANPKHWLEQIKDYAEQNPDDKVVFGYGFLASAFGPQGPTSALIDTVVSDRPVFMLKRYNCLILIKKRPILFLGLVIINVTSWVILPVTYLKGPPIWRPKP